MKDVFLIYNTSCFYEIVILNYFMSLTKCDMLFCSLDGKPIKVTEDFSVNADIALQDLDKNQIRSFIIPGGDISEINKDFVMEYLQALKEKNVLIGGICAGVDALEVFGLLQDVRSTHSVDEDLVSDKNIITARANAYVDFAVEIAKKLNLFTSEEDMQETIDFWKYHKRVQ